jgi:hypothetical protein
MGGPFAIGARKFFAQEPTAVPSWGFAEYQSHMEGSEDNSESGKGSDFDDE